MTSSAHESTAADRSLPDVPRLVFLDTNAVQNLASFGEFIYENGPIADVDNKLRNKGQKIRDDVLALAELMDLGRRGGLPFVISPRTIKELALTKDQEKLERLMFCGIEWAHYSLGLLKAISEEPALSTSFRIIRLNHRQRHHVAGLMSSLPDEGDRQLMVDALELNCDVFLTMDYKTIWNMRDKIRQFGIRILRPVELADEMRPLAGLLR